MSQRQYISAMGIINALGCGASQISSRLFSGDTSGMQAEKGWFNNGAAIVGRARGTLPQVPVELADYSCRNNQLLLAAFEQIRPAVESALHQHGRMRVGVVLGTSTSGMAEGEAAIAAHHASGKLPDTYRYIQQQLGTPALFLALHLGILGPAYTISTACTSSAKAFQSARHLLRQGICDAVIVGGVDSLCKLTINGFNSLESIASRLTNPMSLNRQGINIGEGAALFLLTKEETEVEMMGVGETSDAYHMSSPHPEGVGAESAMHLALADALITEDEVNYINLHATATQKNDAMESHATNRVFGLSPLCSGTKPMTGHTLGAAGATELAFCWLALQNNRLPPHIWDGMQDPALANLRLVGYDQPFIGKSRICMSNSFAFGGSNASLIIGDNRSQR